VVSAGEGGTGQGAGNEAGAADEEGGSHGGVDGALRGVLQAGLKTVHHGDAEARRVAATRDLSGPVGLRQEA
jgi:hypothetical protein